MELQAVAVKYNIRLLRVVSLLLATLVEMRMEAMLAELRSIPSLEYLTMTQLSKGQELEVLKA